LNNCRPFPIIRLEEKTIPKAVATREIAKKHKDFLKNKIEELITAGVIKESTSPWRHNPVIVKIPNGDFRMTINYKPVNSVTISDAFPFPKPDELISRLAGARFFSSLDFNQFYYQLSLNEGDQEKTAFHALGNLYQFTRLPFGLKNAVAYCSRLISKLFRNLENVIIYIDDLLIFGKTKEEHDNTLTEVLKRIEGANLSLNKNKCQFTQQKISFLGYLIESGTVRPDPSRIGPILDFPSPKNAKALQRFIGIAVYYSKYIKDFSSVVKPLNDKLKKFDDWDDQSNESFLKIKREIKGAMLHLPEENDKLVLSTDASNDTISAVLEDSKRRPVYFCSRILNTHEKRYDTTEKEALAIYYGITRLRKFLLGRRFLVLSDHKPLKYIFNNEKASPKVIRWNLALQEFNFEVQHCPGKDNAVPDALTRVNVLDSTWGEKLVSEKEIEEAQFFDEQCRVLKLAIKRNYKYKPVELDDDLWRMRRSLVVEKDIIKSDTGKILVPYKKRIRVLKVAHSVHLGEVQTYENVVTRFTFPSIRQNVKRLISNCRICSLVKAKHYSPPASPVITRAPMEVLAIDFVGPLPVSMGFRYLLVVIDHFSRFPWVYPIKDMSTETVITKIKEIFSLCGFPDALLSDRGTSFESEAFKNFLHEYDIKKLRTNTYHPKGNSICERFNKTIKGYLKMYCLEKGWDFNKWALALSSAMFAYRNTRHTVTGYRPVDLFFGFRVKGYIPNGKQEDIRNQRKDLKTKEKTKFRLDGKAKGFQFRENEEAWLHKNTLGKWKIDKEEVKIIKPIDMHTYMVRNKLGNTFKVATERLAPMGKLELKKGNEDEWEKTLSLSGYLQNKSPLIRRKSTTQSESLETAKCDHSQCEDSLRSLPRRSNRPSHMPDRLKYEAS